MPWQAGGQERGDLGAGKKSKLKNQIEKLWNKVQK
jgi:hypothetical protein